MAGKKNLRDLLVPLQGRPRPAAAGEESPALQAIWDVVARIPRGFASTYGDVARSAIIVQLTAAALVRARRG